jgi:hypothetical protein
VFAARCRPAISRCGAASATCRNPFRCMVSSRSART